MKLSLKQYKGYRLLQNREYRQILFSGGARSGKSILIAAWIVAVCETYPNVQVGVFRRYRRSTTATVLKTFQEVVNGRNWVYSKSDGVLTSPTGSQVAFYGTRDDNGEKLLGLSLDIAWVNEATEIAEEEFAIIKSRLSGTVVPIRKIIADCNPKNLAHWVRRYFILRVSEEGHPLQDSETIQHLHFIPTDNPFLPEDTVKTLQALTGTAYKRLWLGEWSDQSGMVFDEFQEDVHVLSTPPQHFEYYVGGIDFGYTNPFVFLLAGVSKDGDVYILGEHYQTQTLIPDHVKSIKSLIGDKPLRWTVADSEDAQSRAELNRLGLPTTATKKAEMGVLDGVMKVKEYMQVRGNGKPRLYFFKGKTPRLLNEIQNLSWKAGKEEYAGEDHGIDALRYIIQKLQKPVFTGAGGLAKH